MRGKLPRLLALLLAAVLLPVLAACGSSSSGNAFGKGGSSSSPSTAASPATSAGGSAAASAAGGSLVIGSAGFTESQLLAEMYAALLKKAGYQTSIKTVANRELYEPALERGEIDIVPEYAATMAEFLNLKANGPKAKPVASSNVTATVAALNKLAAPRGLKALDPSKAVDQNAFAVSKKFAGQHGLTKLSDLAAKKVPVVLAAGEECATRPFCEVGLKQKYGITITKLLPTGVDTPQTKQAVKNGQAQLGLVLTTDGTLGDLGLVALADDKGLQNADNLIPVVNAKKAGTAQIASALNKLAPVLTTEDLANLNKQVDEQRMKASDVAVKYLQSKGLL